MTEKKSLWRMPIMWLVVGLPLASIVAGVGLVITATSTGGADSVTDKVDRMSQIQTTDLGPDSQAQALKLSAILRIDAGVVEVLPVTGEFRRNVPLRLSLEHPLQAQEDRVLELKPSVHGWQVEADIDETHDWRLQLTPADTQWRLKGRLPKQQHATRLAPSVPAAE